MTRIGTPNRSRKVRSNRTTSALLSASSWSAQSVRPVRASRARKVTGAPDYRSIDLEEERGEAGEERREPLLAEHPPSDEELGREAGDGRLGDGKGPAVLEQRPDLRLGEVEAEATESHRDEHVVAEEVARGDKDRPEGSAPEGRGMRPRASPCRDGQSPRSVEREDGRRVETDDRPGGGADRARRRREEGGAGQRRSARVFSPRSKRTPTAASLSDEISSPISRTVSTT